MNGFFKTTVLALAGASLLAGATAASAADAWQLHHSRRAEVNARLANQNRRITQERREGEITRTQARQMRAEDRGIRAQERYLANGQNTHISVAQQRQLNREENGVSRQIGR